MTFIDVVFMYISVVPIALTLRTSQRRKEESVDVPHSKRTIPQQIGAWLSRRKNFLGADLTVLFIIMVAICITADEMINGAPGYTMFSVLFEVVSAYGTVGLSMGFPNTWTSFCAQWRDASKIFLVVIMLVGRHRGLPSDLDVAVTVTRLMRRH